MLPTVFLSLSGHDEAFVGRVHENLPDGLAYFYPKSFENGERLLDAMEERVEGVAIFALFASKASLASCWVQFEINRARLAKIRRPEVKCLVFPIDKDVSYSDLPGWMQEYWIGTAGQSARDIARYIRGALSNVAASAPTALQPFGRGALIDQVRRELQTATFTTRETPNVFIFAGNAGIGRRTVEHAFLQRAFPSLPELGFGPIFDLPQFADMPDLYRAVRRELEDHFSLDTFKADLEKFQSLSLFDQVSEIVNSMLHFADLGQAVTIVTGNGLYEDKGVLKPWVPLLFGILRDNRALHLCFISNRQLHDKELRPHNNVLQFHVEHLPDEEIRALIIAAASIFGAEPQLPADPIVHSIGGHPSIARSIARLLANRGPLLVNNNPRYLFDIQEEVLSDSLSFAALTDLEKDLLSVLSWVPQLNGNLLNDILIDRHAVSKEALADILDGLMAGCLVQLTGPNYYISPPMRSMFRRKHGYGSKEMMTSFAKTLKIVWADSVRDNELNVELFDALVYMTALEGGTLPPEFDGLLLASTLQEVVKEAYDRRHADESGLARAITWGLPAKSMRMDETTREEILSYVVRSQVRLQKYTDAKDLLRFMEGKEYRSVPYLKSFLIRLSGGDLSEAVTLLREARRIKKYLKSVVADLAICLRALGRWPALKELLSEEARYIGTNAVLMDISIGMLIADGDFPKAEAEIDRLRALPFDDGRADSRMAAILMNRDRQYGKAQELLTSVLQRQTRGALGVRRLRALAAARGGNGEAARRDSEFLRSRPGGEDTFHRIEAEIKLVQKDYPGAASEAAKVKSETVQDRLLKARILEAQGLDVSTPLAERDKLLSQVTSIRSVNKSYDEYDVE